MLGNLGYNRVRLKEWFAFDKVCIYRPPSRAKGCRHAVSDSSVFPGLHGRALFAKEEAICDQRSDGHQIAHGCNDGRHFHRVPLDAHDDDRKASVRRSV